jgi:hypothetical protein
MPEEIAVLPIIAADIIAAEIRLKVVRAEEDRAPSRVPID